MGRRLELGLGILLFFLIAGILSGWIIQKICDPICENLDNACKLSREGNTEAATEFARNAYKKWQKSWHGIAALADHSPMDEIDGLFAQAEEYARMGDHKSFAANCARLSKLVTAVAEAHSLSWWNLV